MARPVTPTTRIWRRGGGATQQQLPYTAKAGTLTTLSARSVEDAARTVMPAARTATLTARAATTSVASLCQHYYTTTPSCNGPHGHRLPSSTRLSSFSRRRSRYNAHLSIIISTSRRSASTRLAISRSPHPPPCLLAVGPDSAESDRPPTAPPIASRRSLTRSRAPLRLPLRPLTDQLWSLRHYPLLPAAAARHSRTVLHLAPPTPHPTPIPRTSIHTYS